MYLHTWSLWFSFIILSSWTAPSSLRASLCSFSFNNWASNLSLASKYCFCCPFNFKCCSFVIPLPKITFLKINISMMKLIVKKLKKIYFPSKIYNNYMFLKYTITFLKDEIKSILTFTLTSRSGTFTRSIIFDCRRTRTSPAFLFISIRFWNWQK